MSEGDSKVWFNRHLVAENGMALELDLSAVTRELAAPEVAVRIDLGVGAASATVWTCDLSEDYIRINGSYIS
jgi:glutamate N-acetyltransferase/amino-acid N-acetyltransferase